MEAIFGYARLNFYIFQADKEVTSPNAWQRAYTLWKLTAATMLTRIRSNLLLLFG